MVVRTALVTAGDTDSGLTATRFLASAGYRVVTAGSRRPLLGARSRYASSHHFLSEADPEQFEARLVELVERIRPALFLPLGTASALVASKHRERLMAVAGLNVPTFEAFNAAYEKEKCHAECRALGIPCPAEYSFEEAVSVLERNRDAVVVVKPAQDVGGSVGVKYARTPQQLAAVVRECVASFDTAVIQEYIPGGVGAMKAVVVMFSADSTLLAAATMRKVKRWPEPNGRTAVSVSTADAALVKQVLPFFEKWHWSGPAEVELKTDPVTGEDKVIEINPRLPGWLRFLCDHGLGVPALASGAAENAGLEPMPFPSYPVGAVYHNPFLVFERLCSTLLPGGLSTREIRPALRDMKDALPAAATALRDPVPLVAKTLGLFTGAS